MSPFRGWETKLRGIESVHWRYSEQGLYAETVKNSNPTPPTASSGGNVHSIGACVLPSGQPCRSAKMGGKITRGVSNSSLHYMLHHRSGARSDEEALLS